MPTIFGTCPCPQQVAMRVNPDKTRESVKCTKVAIVTQDDDGNFISDCVAGHQHYLSVEYVNEFGTKKSP